MVFLFFSFFFFRDDFSAWGFQSKIKMKLNKVQAVGRNLANESIDKYLTSRNVSCFKSSYLLQEFC